MNKIVGLLLVLCFSLPACSADENVAVAPVATEESSMTSKPAVENTVSGTPATSDPAAAPADEIVVAQAAMKTPAVDVTAPAERADIVAGKQYRVLRPAQPTSSSPDKVEVAEIFMYSCPHCLDFEPFVKNYLQDKPAYVSFVRIPASFNSTARLHTKAYYMAETLGILEDVHMDFFNEYHVKKNRLANEKVITRFFVDRGVTEDQVVGAFNSFAVDTKVRQADNLGRRYQIDSVPSVVINGKYVTSGAMAGSTKKLREIIDYLVAKEAAQL